MTQMVKIGKREVEYMDFVDAVKRSKRYTEVCDFLGFNSTVGTTRDAVREQIEVLHLDTSHFKYKYNKSDDWQESIKNRQKKFNISEDNQQYYDSLEQEFEAKQTSFITYKPNIGAYLEFIGDKDFTTVTVTDIENYVKDNKDGSESTKKNCLAHIRSMMIHAVKNNVNNAVDKVSKEMLIWLI
jgi:hypothetical protein